MIETQREKEGVEEKVIRGHEDMHETVQIHLTKEKLSKCFRINRKNIQFNIIIIYPL